MPRSRASHSTANCQVMDAMTTSIPCSRSRAIPRRAPGAHSADRRAAPKTLASAPRTNEPSRDAPRRFQAPTTAARIAACRRDAPDVRRAPHRPWHPAAVFHRDQKQRCRTKGLTFLTSIATSRLQPVVGRRQCLASTLAEGSSMADNQIVERQLQERVEAAACGAPLGEAEPTDRATQ